MNARPVVEEVNVGSSEVRDLIAWTCRVCGVVRLTSQIDFTWNARFTARMGDARWDPQTRRGLIRLSSVLWPKADRDEQVETVVHEACHVIAGHLYGPSQGHGPNWRALMRRCGYENAARCHNVDRDGIAARRQQRQVRAVCGCSQGVMIGPIQAARARRGSVYRCRRCDQTIRLPKLYLRAGIRSRSSRSDTSA